MSLVQCQQLSKRYGDKLALDNVSFELPAGDPVALVGPNGAGKTTLMSILCGFMSPSSGSVSVLDHTPGTSALFGRLSALPQDALLDPNFSVLHQLTLFARLQGFSQRQARVEAARVLELMQLAEVMQEKNRALSHGMNKRVAIAQALIGSPELVILDEPTAGLDPVNARNIRDIVLSLSSVTTFIISSHNLAELERLCNIVLHLEGGRLQQQANLSEHAESNYLTLQMVDMIQDGILTAVQSLQGVQSVMQRQRNEIVVRYDLQLAPNLDQSLLHCLAQNGWQYRQLIKGKTLEDQLFAMPELSTSAR